MRILYVTDALGPSGVANKSVAQAHEWQRQGHEVWLSTARHPAVLTPTEATERRGAAPPLSTLARRWRAGLDFRLLYAGTLLRESRRRSIDLLYTREVPFAPTLPRFMRLVPTVLEINGDAIAELPSRRQRFVRRHVRAWEIRHAAGVVYVSRELVRRCAPAVAQRSCVIGNPCLILGPDLLPPPAKPGRPTLAMVGTPVHHWNGFDKFVRMAELLPECDFVVIGAEMKGPRNLRSLPHLPQAEVDHTLRGCTLGVGSLALHRAGLREASPLKSRNYLALGLPVIQAYEDTDLGPGDACVLALPNEVNNVEPHVDRIRAFAHRAHADPGLSARALDLALGRLSLARKEGERLAFMEACLRAAR
jgi:hypothetical protein